jgi:Spy/CpxP family protein refolding chaperone
MILRQSITKLFFINLFLLFCPVALLAQEEFEDSRKPNFDKQGEFSQSDENREKPPFRPDHARQEQRGSVLQALQLNESQKQKLKELRKKSDVKELRQQFLEAKRSLNNLIHKPGSSEKDIMDQLDIVSKQQAGLNKSRVKNLIEFKRLLEPDQFQLLQKHLHERRENRGPRGRNEGKFLGENRPGGPSGEEPRRRGMEPGGRNPRSHALNDRGAGFDGPTEERMRGNNQKSRDDLEELDLGF